MHHITKRRLQDGTNALAAKKPKSLPELRAYVEQLRDALAAMQSLDDLGSPSLNAAAMADHDEIMRRWKAAEKQLKEAERSKG